MPTLCPEKQPTNQKKKPNKPKTKQQENKIQSKKLNHHHLVLPVDMSCKSISEET